MAVRRSLRFPALGAFACLLLLAPVPSAGAVPSDTPSTTVGFGAVTLTVNLPGPGTLTAVDTAASTAGSRRKRSIRNAAASSLTGGPTSLLLRPTSSARKKLARGRRVRVRVLVTFIPTGGQPASQTRTVVLKRRRR
jgi:hypothetical protein